MEICCQCGGGNTNPTDADVADICKCKEEQFNCLPFEECAAKDKIIEGCSTWNKSNSIPFCFVEQGSRCRAAVPSPWFPNEYMLSNCPNPVPIDLPYDYDRTLELMLRME
eukprot:UN18806